jgi:hypothetical protein
MQPVASALMTLEMASWMEARSSTAGSLRKGSWRIWADWKWTLSR